MSPDGAPGGEPGTPPLGNGFFDQIDIIAALSPGHYLTGKYGAIAPHGKTEADLIYVPVPEPSCALLFGLGVLTACGCWGRRGSQHQRALGTLAVPFESR